MNRVPDDNRVPDENRVPVHFRDGNSIGCGGPIDPEDVTTDDPLDVTCERCIEEILKEELSGYY